ncbi:hypothetical protein, partial [Burkholderia ubonensis]|uniref:hypothetical protein n=1 Tax=Burkholderia ubonensis TaxID=101571 RepID=UPI001E634DA1
MSQLIAQDHVDFHCEAEATTMNLTPVGSDIGKTAFPTVAADSGELAEGCWRRHKSDTRRRRKVELNTRPCPAGG